MKFDTANLDRLVTQIAALVPGASTAREELRSLVAASLNAALTRMNLVSREDFDAQAALLARTREKLETLQARMDRLESSPD